MSMNKPPKEVMDLLRSIGIPVDDAKDVTVHAVGPGGLEGLAEMLREGKDPQVKIHEVRAGTTDMRIIDGPALAYVRDQMTRMGNAAISDPSKAEKQYNGMIKEILAVYEYHLGKTGDITAVLASLTAVFSVIVGSMNEVSGNERGGEQSLRNIRTLTKAMEDAALEVPLFKSYAGPKIEKEQTDEQAPAQD